VAKPVSAKVPLPGPKDVNTSTQASQLDRLIHERLRLGIISALAANHSLSFNELKKLLDTTDGNLSVHARKLEEANYISCSKTFEGRVPKTQYALTAAGKRLWRNTSIIWNPSLAQ